MIQKFKIAFLKWFRHVKVFPWPLFMVYDPHTFNVKGHHYYQARDIIQPGDIVLRKYVQYLDTYFIPGKYSHAGIYVGGEKIIHSMTPDVQWTDLVSFMRCDRFAIVRPNISEEDIELAIRRAKSKIGISYDYDFIYETEDFTGREFSCSELCYYAYKKNLKELDWYVRKQKYFMFDKELFLPHDILPCHHSISTIVYET